MWHHEKLQLLVIPACWSRVDLNSCYLCHSRHNLTTCTCLASPRLENLLCPSPDLTMSHTLLDNLLCPSLEPIMSTHQTLFLPQTFWQPIMPPWDLENLFCPPHPSPHNCLAAPPPDLRTYYVEKNIKNFYLCSRWIGFVTHSKVKQFSVGDIQRS